MQGNNEVSVWDLETGIQQLSFWASDTPPLSKPNVSTFLFESLYKIDYLRLIRFESAECTITEKLA